MFTSGRRATRFSRSSSGSTSPSLQRSARVSDSPVMIITDVQRNAEFVSPTHERLSVGTQQGFQCLEANAGHRLLPDQRIV